jgi:hypothetical protein
MSKKKQFDVPEVIAALKAAVETRGADYVYVNASGERASKDRLVGCQYTHKDEKGNLTPGCIAGQVYYDLTGLFVQEQSPFVQWAPEFLDRFTLDALDLLRQAQRLQDRGSTWGEAVEVTLNRLTAHRA